MTDQPMSATDARPGEATRTPDEIIRRAEEALDGLCSGKQQFTMTVPPDDRDHDMRFADLIDLAKQLAPDSSPAPEVASFGMREWVRQQLLDAGFVIGAHRDDRANRLADAITAALTAQREPTTELDPREVMDALDAQADLLVRYRVGGRPSGKTLERVGKANGLRDRLHAAYREAERGEQQP